MENFIFCAVTSVMRTIGTRLKVIEHKTMSKSHFMVLVLIAFLFISEVILDIFTFSLAAPRPVRAQPYTPVVNHYIYLAFLDL